jgi:hypothetical protein
MDYQAFFNTFVGLYLISLYWGLDRNVRDPNLLSGKNALQDWYFADIFYTLCAIALKSAAATQIARHATRLWQRRVVWVFTVVNVLLSVYMVFLFIFRCTPVNWFWDRAVSHPTNSVDGYCHGKTARRSMHMQSVVSAAVDWVFATLPAFIMKDVHLRRVEKFAMWAVVIMAEVYVLS